jgi:DNA mismatch repair protein MutL
MTDHNSHIQPARVIHILPERVASQIAAGEVVERPASAVKELVENAIDAGARSIAIEIDGGGRDLIAVADDGCGMSRDDAIVSLRRHATSKIRDAADLHAVRTLGFRGEALASIASVSNLTIRTRRAEDPHGTELVVRGGHCDTPAACALAAGTRIEVRELFFNTPARLKFLKTIATEQGAIVEVIQRLAIANPAIAFSLDTGGRKLLEMPRARSIVERFRGLFGDRMASAMLPFEAAATGARVHGIAASSQTSFASPRMIFTCVNGRVVRDRALARAIAQAYQTLMPRGRHPAVVLLIEMNPDDVDVNVHPMKTEVRFRSSGGIFELVYRALRARLSDQSERPAEQLAEQLAEQPGQASPSGFESAPIATSAAAASAAVAISATGSASAVAALPAADGLADPARYRPLRLVPDSPRTAPSQPALGLGFRSSVRPHELSPDISPANSGSLTNGHAGSIPAYSELKVLGQLFAGYIALEGPDGLILVDQHAAHERVTFERLKAQLAEGSVEVQALLTPIPLELDPARIAQIEPSIPGLNAIGFEVERFGPTSIVLKGAPAVFGSEDPVRLLTDMLDDLGDGGAVGSRNVFEDLLKQLACHGSVRVGRMLDGSEITALMADLDRTPFKTNCPHGRPTHISFGRGQIERMFRR